MRRAACTAGMVVLVGGWIVAAADYGIVGHMAAHMAAVSIAAPLIAFGLAGSRADPAMRWPVVVTPLLMSLIELVVVWGWHVPVARAFAARTAIGLMLEQTMFCAAGLLLWSACLGARYSDSSARRGIGVVALLLTTMHMTLLGVLIALAPRPLFDSAGFSCLGVTLSPLMDQQVGGIVMLFVGAGSYLLGGVYLASRLLWNDRSGLVRQWY